MELPKFNKTLDEVKTIEDKWYYFLKHVTESNHIIADLVDNTDIKEAYEVLDRYLWSEEELRYYENVMKKTLVG